MLEKTPEFMARLEQRKRQFSINKKKGIEIKGSLNYLKYITDIDLSTYVYFNEKFIQILINKIRHLKDFIFIYLNAGVNTKYLVPWIIYPNKGCDFDLEKTKKWLKSLKNSEIPKELYKEIENILYKKSLTLSDLIRIEFLLKPFWLLKWSLKEMIKGYKIVNGSKYTLLQGLKNRHFGIVIRAIYIDGNKAINVDVGYRDHRYKKANIKHMYKIYQEKWWKILKGYRYDMSPDYQNSYYEMLQEMSYLPSLIERVNLLKKLIKYNIANGRFNESTKQEILTDAKNIDIETEDFDKIVSIAEEKLKRYSKKYVEYYFDKLNDKGKRIAMNNFNIMKEAIIPVKSSILVKRRNDGIKCPFFTSQEEQFIKIIASNSLLKFSKIKDCITTSATEHGYTVKYLLHEYFNIMPIKRLFLEESDKYIYIKGIFDTDDYSMIKHGHHYQSYYFFPLKDKSRLQLYLLTGIWVN